MLKSIGTAGLLMLALICDSFAQNEELNFKNRQAIVINNAPTQLELSGFNFQNEFRQGGIRLITKLSWKNISNKPMTAFEAVILKYDPFNRPIASGGRLLVTGNNSGNWAPLMPGQSSSDGMIGLSDEPVLTSIVYVRAIRFEDGSVWTADISLVEKAIRQRLPVLTELGAISPPMADQKK